MPLVPNGFNGYGPQADAVNLTRGGVTARCDSAGNPWNIVSLPGNITQFEVRPTDFWNGETDKNRAELARVASPLSFGTDYWASFSVHFSPSAFTSTNTCVFFQAHATPDGSDIESYPNLSLNWRPSTQEYRIQTAYSAENPLVNPGTLTTQLNYTSAPAGQWHNFVVLMNFSTAAAGKLTVYHNGVQKLNLTGLNMGYVDAIGPFLKWGIYHPLDTYTAVRKIANMEISTSSLVARAPAPLNIVE